ncbi:MAG: acylneuraminate cytidylyltransferase [Spirochaetes bacterium]|nr:MAG: acylneuraminate cytidylyltransferase [Spirochaetota bacterium]
MVVNGVFNGNKIKPRVIAIIQARMQSTRLPGKAMEDLAGRPLLAHVIERAQRIEHVDEVVVATCIGEENRAIIDLAASMGAKIFVGSMENVLERYWLALCEFGGEFIVRVTGDNPFTDPEYASMAVDISLESKPDLCSVTNLPLGTGVEIIKAGALEEAYRNGDKTYHREHVTPYIKEHPELFNIERIPANFKNPFPGMRLTVDTPEDMVFARAVYERVYAGQVFPLSEVISVIETDPDLLKINSGVEQRPMVHSERKDA